jgi:VWFA-related protein
MKNLLILTLLLHVSSWGQGPPVFRSNLDLVAIPCAVVDRNGVAVRDLKQDEFEVRDNGVRRKVEYLWVDTELPLTLGVIIDSSESQRDLVKQHEKTVLELLTRMMRPGDRAFVVMVDEDVRLRADLSGSVDELGERVVGGSGALFGEPCPKSAPKAGVRGISQCGGTPLWNAVYDAARLKLRTLTGNKALLILSDGVDTGSTRTLKAAMDEAQKAEAAVYAIQYQSGFGSKFAPGLYQLVSETAGTLFRPLRDEYVSIVARLETDLRNRYVVGFRPERISMKVRHEVQVEVTRPDLSVRARNTYFQ